MKLEEAIQSNRFVDEKHKATINILYTAYWLKNNLSTALKKTDLTIEQFNVMRILKGMHPEPLCVKDIGSRMVEKSSNVPRIVDKLVAKKLARRATSKADKRETLVSLTDRGTSMLEAASAIVDETTEAIHGISFPEANQLNELLEKMRE